MLYRHLIRFDKAAIALNAEALTAPTNGVTGKRQRPDDQPEKISERRQPKVCDVPVGFREAALQMHSGYNAKTQEPARADNSCRIDDHPKHRPQTGIVQDAHEIWQRLANADGAGPT